MMDLIISLDKTIFHEGMDSLMRLPFVTKQFKQAVLKQFARYVTIRYASKVVDIVHQPSYLEAWRPIEPLWKSLKEKNHWTTDAWKDVTTLKSSIGYRYLSDSAYAIGINPAVRYPGTNLAVADVAKWLEYGLGSTKEFEGLKAVPIFRRLRDEFLIDLARLYRDFKKLYGEELDDLMVLTTVGAYE